MATTANYGWTTPDDTDLVKDGASAIRSLGTAIDTTVKSVSDASGLVHIETQTFSAVSSVSFNGVFSATYDFYIIFCVLKPSTSLLHNFRFRAGGTPASAALYNLQRFNAAGGSVASSQTDAATSAFIGSTSANNTLAQINLAFPFDTTNSIFQVQGVNAGRLTEVNGWQHGSTISYDGFEINTSTGNTTGSITVVGVKK